MKQQLFLCPYLDRCDTRCANRFTMINLPEAFRLCAGSFDACGVYHQIRLSELPSEHEEPFVRTACPTPA